MLPYHSVLGDYSPIVGFYVLDCRLAPSGTPEITLTVLVDIGVAQYLVDDMRHRLLGCMSQSTLEVLAADFDVISTSGRQALWFVEIMRTWRGRP